MQSAMVKDPDAHFTKTLTEKGDGHCAPREGAVCKIIVKKITSVSLDETVCTVKFDEPTEITIGL